MSHMSLKHDINGIALQWFTSYLLGRKQSVCVEGKTSHQDQVTYGVPQGSVLWPVLFSMYTKELSTIMEGYDVHYHKYADDIQIYTDYDPSDVTDTHNAIQRIQNCIVGVKSWMTVKTV